MIPAKPLNLTGFSTITKTYRIDKRTRDIQLSSNPTFSLPTGSWVVAYSIRGRVNDDYRAINDDILLDDNFLAQTYLNLIPRFNETIFNNLCTLRLKNFVQFAEPFRAKIIDWQTSQFTILNASDLGEEIQSLELTIYYTTDCGIEIPQAYRLYSDQLIPPYRTVPIIIPTANKIRKYNIAFSDVVNVDPYDIILGFKIPENKCFPPGGQYNPVDDLTLNNTFLNLNRSQYSFLRDFPLALAAYPELFPSQDFFPIEPQMRVQIDWESSTLQVNGTANPSDGQAFVLELVYIKNNKYNDEGKQVIKDVKADQVPGFSQYPKPQQEVQVPKLIYPNLPKNL